MSRTYRRTGRESYCFNPNGFSRWAMGYYIANGREIIEEGSKEYKKEKARYHSDMGFGSYSRCGVPSWYCRLMDKKIDTHNSREIYKFLSNADYEPNTYNRYINNASWYW